MEGVTMNELLIVDILCYLRQQSKYDEVAKTLFNDMLDEIKVSFVKDTEDEIEQRRRSV